MADDLAAIRDDLAAEQAALDEVLASLPATDWSRATPSPGWTIADQIGHLRYFDGTATLAILDPDAFSASVTALLTAAQEDGDGGDRATLGEWRRLTPVEQLAAWRDGRRRLADAAAQRLTEATRVPWYGPPMSAKSFLTARLMEAWAHGRDVCDAAGRTQPATARLRHVAHLGCVTRGWSYAVRGEQPPAGTVRVDLTGPDGERWTYGNESDDTVSGSAEEFCLVVTQRRHLDDTGLVTGRLGRHWLLRAQAFAGQPTDPPAPSRRRPAGAG